MLFENSFELLFITRSFVFSNHSSNNFCVSPLFFSYGLFLYNIFCKRSPYTIAFNNFSTILNVNLNPGFFSIPTTLNEITGTCSYPASFNALRINPI